MKKSILNPLYAKLKESATFRQVPEKMNQHKDFMSNLYIVILASYFLMTFIKANEL